MVGQGHRSYQREFDTTPGGSGRQEGLACSGPWGHKESVGHDLTTKQQQSNHGHLTVTLNLSKDHQLMSADHGTAASTGREAVLKNWQPLLMPVSYTHLTLPTKA